MAEGLLTGLIDFALDAAKILATSTAVGALIGALFGGVGAIPGAEIGFEIGLLILNWYGIYMLVEAVLGIAGSLLSQLGKFITLAWNANGDKEQIEAAGKALAEALGVLISAVLMALAAYVLKKGSEALLKTKFAKTVGESRLAQWLKKRQKMTTTKEQLEKSNRLEWEENSKHYEEDGKKQQEGGKKLLAKTISERIDALKKAGVKGDLDTIKRNAELGQPGAIGEVEAMERWVAEGRSVESLPEVQQGPKNPDFKVDGEITEVKTRNEPLTVGDTYISEKIKYANSQIKKSSQVGPDGGRPQGQIEIQLNSQAAESIRENPNVQSYIESQVHQQFRPNQSRSLKRVAVYVDGKLYGEWVRTAGNDIVKTFP